MLVCDILGIKKAGDVGLELEIESLSPEKVPVPSPPWQIKADESLRHFGYEYYTTRPIRCDSTKLPAIKKLTDELRKCNLVFDSPRTSLHVHVNILEHTPLQVWTAAATYWLLDNLLIKFCGEDQRAGNVFCLRAKDSEAVIDSVLKDLKEDTPFASLRGDSVRYASQNINAIHKFGSLEYRGMRGVIDHEIIDTWSTEMYNIVHKTKRFRNPADMLDTYLSVGTRDFLHMIFSCNFVLNLAAYPDMERLVKQNVGMLCSLCYAYDWDKWQEKINKKTLKRAEKLNIFDEVAPRRMQIRPRGPIVGNDYQDIQLQPDQPVGFQVGGGDARVPVEAQEFQVAPPARRYGD